MLSENPRNLILLKASAGSGKTYNLALNYLALALQEQSRFRHILAVTFTNKATREMKERIINFLVKIARSQDQNIISQVAEKSELSASEVIKRAQIELRNILHNYSYFSVKTIDSFNQKILRGFAREIGLLGNFKLELDTQMVLEVAVTEVIDKAGEIPEIKKWIVDFTRARLEDGRSWDISKDLKGLASELYNEQYKILETLNPQLISSTSELGVFISKLTKSKRTFEDQMKSIATQAIDVFDKYHLQASDFFQGNRGVFQYFFHILKPSGKYAPNSYVVKCLEDVEKWPSSKTQRKDEIINLVNNQLLSLLQEANSLYLSEITEYNTVSSILKNLYALGLFNEIKKAIDHYKKEHDVFLLSDTNIFLRGIIKENEAPFIYEKTGGWFYHYLVDEFQDTSKLQWENLKPLIVNSLDEQNSNLVVGDAKQSIYRWRGGDWELIEKKLLEDIQPGRINIQNLDTNWRSAQEVLHFNNALFENLPGEFKKTFEKEAPESLHILGNDFTRLYQNASQKMGYLDASIKGYVEINLVDKEDENGSLKKLKNQLERLQDAGYKLSDIAILTRTKAEGAKIIEYLGEQNQLNGEHRFNTVSNESLLLKNYPAIRLLINSFYFIKDPDNDLNLANLAIAYFNEKEESESLDQLLIKTNFKKEFQTLFPKKFLERIGEFQRYGLHNCSSELIGIFQLDKKSQNAPYLMAFQDTLQSFISDYGNDIFSFLDWWEENKQKLALQNPETIDAIRVMTIHKSKGLEFEAVILPYVDWNIDHEGNKSVFLWCKNENDEYPEQQMVPLKYVKDLSESHFSTAYFEEKQRALIDNLNLCYVAFTRAKRVLMVNTTKSTGNTKGKSVSSLLQQVIDSDSFLPGMEKDDDQFSFGHLHSIKPKGEIEKIVPTTYQISHWGKKAKLKKRGREFFEKGTEDRKEKINYGIIVHEILARISAPTDVPQLLLEYHFQGIISKEEIDQIEAQINSIFSNPVVAGWFKDQWDVKSEQSILSPGNDEMRPDKVLIKDLNAIIIDFKTGKELPEHGRQLARYKQKLKEMGFQSIKAYVLYISKNKVREID